MNRSSSLARSPMPPRTRPMPGPAAPMPRTDWLSRSGGTKPRPAAVHPRLRPRSKKTAKVYRDERIPLVVALLAERPLCEIRWDENCRGTSEGLHEILSRGRGGSITDPENVAAACHYCNGAVSDNPTEAEARGWLRKSGRPSKAVPR